LKILLLSNPKSSHTIKWHQGLKENDINVKVWGFDYNKPKILQIFLLKSLIKEFNPDIIHAHYASSYGLLGALSGFKPFVLSVWGSDIFEFPKKSFLHKMIIKFNLYKADKILSTSNIMAQEIKLYTNKDVEITPFGIDITHFKKLEEKKTLDKSIVIGTVKSLETIYGIEYLIKAFKILIDKYPKSDLRLLIVGKGSQEKQLKQLVKALNIVNQVEFIGFISHQNIVTYLNMIDIFVSVSLSESFGVSALEANACEKPVIATKVAGFNEVIVDGVTGILVSPQDELGTYLALEKLYIDKDLAYKMGKNGRDRVKKLYNWKYNVKKMITIYKELVDE